MLAVLTIVLVTVGLGVVWSYAAERQLAASVVEESSDHLGLASEAFSQVRAKLRSNLQGDCRVLAEDPRLKSTLATEGIDEATVADILKDLRKLRGSGFLLVLTPEGRVFAEAGAPHLRGVDLSQSSVVQEVQGTTDAVVGSWVLDKKPMDLSAIVIRFGEAVIGYLAVGQSIDETVLGAISAQSGVEVASALGSTVVLASSSDTQVKAVFEQVAGMPGAFTGRVLTVDGKPYVTGAVEIPGSTQAYRLLLARSVAAAKPHFERLRWMIFLPPLIVLLAVLLAMSGPRLVRRT
ncbi:MAG TPA: hypothetical protein VKZ63_22425 [Kofleriaceae bacterium]|nr:hypothetical protein [Kofleriaceae bacterium]